MPSFRNGVVQLILVYTAEGNHDSARYLWIPDASTGQAMLPAVWVAVVWGVRRPPTMASTGVVRGISVPRDP
jgi:hypothetical protein